MIFFPLKSTKYWILSLNFDDNRISFMLWPSLRCFHFGMSFQFIQTQFCSMLHNRDDRKPITRCNIKEILWKCQYKASKHFYSIYSITRSDKKGIFLDTIYQTDPSQFPSHVSDLLSTSFLDKWKKIANSINSGFNLNRNYCNV